MSFEGLHKYLKSEIINVARPLASIVKNWSLHERSRMLIIYMLFNASAIAGFYSHVGGCKEMSSLFVVLGKLAYLHAEEV